MGPEYKSEAYYKQVDTIVTMIDGANFQENEIALVDRALMMFIVDTSYSRTAIAEARKVILTKIKRNSI